MKNVKIKFNTLFISDRVLVKSLNCDKLNAMANIYYRIDMNILNNCETIRYRHLQPAFHRNEKASHRHTGPSIVLNLLE